MKTRVLDSWAILECMNGRKPAEAFVTALLWEGEEGKARLLMSAINVGEVYERGHLERCTAEGSIPDFIRRCVCRGPCPETQLPARHRRSGIPVRRSIGARLDRARVNISIAHSIPQELPDGSQPCHVVANSLERRRHRNREQQPRRVPQKSPNHQRKCHRQGIQMHPRPHNLGIQQV